MWRAIILGCVLMVATATAEAGKRSPGNDRNNDGGPRDRREAREERQRERWRRWQYQQPFYPRRQYRRRYVDPWQGYNRCMWQYDDPYYCGGYAPDEGRHSFWRW